MVLAAAGVRRTSERFGGYEWNGVDGKRYIPLFHKLPSRTHRLSTHVASENFSSSSGRKSRGPETVRPSRMPAYPAG